MKEAYLYDRLENEKVRCLLCNHNCVITEGKTGICGVRENRSGILVSLVYGKVIASHCDPIEKKPLFHFIPGSRSYSIATVGCNFRCFFCQNADISQMPSDHNRIMGQDMTPEEIVEDALNTRSASVSYTYTEPTIYYELAVDTARLASSKGLKNVFVSNGYMTEQCLEDMSPDLHAANVDLKAFTDEFYKEQCGAKLEPVLRTLETMKRLGIWLEVTTLLIPGLNDSKEELKEISQFLANLDTDIPWHISRFHPTYRLTDIPSTPPDTIQKARDLGYEAGLKYVYTGNLPGDDGEKTFCHNCGELLIDRFGFTVTKNRIKENLCPECGSEIPGVWD
ncbi:MAG: AmmeMemoRadiSam system radical SAM enzyme [Deltaproteobacteria bacterium]|nr:AmmeMemoRadiSam system radical SAM enzyme [Deltaproteobacteria bacterium]MBW1908835.1 AmmeMemoRadiSam system radical SAM enzyme [Deltaproteobacteria bacterium]MBW2034710.1 AmmeMemoRadiSam system radical SAM enzyme [Deltaproteobacteria bacterium]MBW2114791.1 AmmeMemoRadiSam system radical SAM enzyme [Deltaproteobacteria bacterium]MBW2169380.1 AmmeMemoRadiSam system radical SAM enzyme [Deltaproteobacteria bacterium]